MLSSTSVTPVRALIARGIESSEATRARRVRRASSESTESRAASRARTTRVLSPFRPHTAADIVAFIAGQARETAGRGGAEHAARVRHSTRLILKWES